MNARTRIKKHWADHKTSILVSTTLTMTAAFMIARVGLVQHDNFLREHDLYDEFYNPED